MKNVNDYDILAIGPAFSDILIQTSDSKYSYLQKYLFSNNGSWCSIDDIDKFKYILSILSIDCPSLFMEAGSTILGTLSALPKIFRRKTCLCSYKGIAKEQISLDSYSIYNKAVTHLCLSLKSTEFNGINKIGLIIVSPNHPERLLVSLQEDCYSISGQCLELPSSKYLIVNAYEMQNPLYSDTIIAAIQSRNYKVILGLGDRNIITGNLRDIIIKYINSGDIFCLAGNYEEFQALEEFDDANSLRCRILYTKVPNILITQGDKGMTGYIENQSLFQPSETVSNIVSTSGAGDVALGVFLTGILTSASLESILKNAVKYSAEILKRQSNIFREGIENVYVS